MSSDFHTLTVQQIERSTPDCSIITLSVPEELRQVFAYQQGQFLTVRAQINEESVTRSYSLCSSPLDGQWQIGVKQIPGGRFSTWANNTLTFCLPSKSCIIL